MKATEQYFPVVLFILYEMVLTFESGNEILRPFKIKCYKMLLSCKTAKVMLLDNVLQLI